MPLPRMASIPMFPPLLTSESTTTPIGLNHKTLFSVSISSEPLNIEPTPLKIEKVITINSIAVTEFIIIFLVLVKKLSAAGASVVAYDPKGSDEFKKAIKTNKLLQVVDKKEDCLKGADALILMTEWSEFKIDSTSSLRNNLNQLIIFDGRNYLDLQSLDLNEFEYYGVGKSQNEA